MENFDRRIKSRLENYNSEIDPLDIWEGIQIKRNKKKKRMGGFLWIAASIVLFRLLELGLALSREGKLFPEL